MRRIKQSMNTWLAATLFLFAGMVQGQETRVNSPYTLFGIGNLTNTNSNVRSLSMGDIKYGLRSNTLINPANPASYTAFDSLSFLFEGAISGGLVTLKSINQSENSNYATLSYLTFGFPVTKWWKASFGLMPFSNVGYEVATDEQVNHFGLVRYTNDGSGGFNQVYWGNGFRITKNLSAGFNAAYIFGTIDNGLSVTFPDSAFYFSTRKDLTYSASDFMFTYGLQYTIPFKNKTNLTIGASFNNTTRLNARRDLIIRNFYGEINEIRYYKDTVTNQNNFKGDIILPKSIGAGFILEKENKWLAGFDFNWQNWEEFKSFGQSDTLKNRLSFGAGIQFIPDKYSIFSYLERLSYRFGIKYTNSYLNVNGNQLNEFGISVGVGFPVWKSHSQFNLGVEFGKWGTTANELVQENYIKFIFALSIYENWFIKPKYF